MEELKTLISQSQAGDLEAYGSIVRRFQDVPLKTTEIEFANLEAEIFSDISEMT